MMSPQRKRALENGGGEVNGFMGTEEEGAAKRKAMMMQDISQVLKVLNNSRQGPIVDTKSYSTVEGFYEF